MTPLLAAMLVALAASACQREDAAMSTAPADDAAAATTPAEPVPPMENMDPCAGMTGSALDDCQRRQTDQVPPAMDDVQPITPADPTMPPRTTDPQDTPPPPPG